MDAIADRMPLNLYYEWRAYAKLNPFGQPRDDWNAAMIASVISNTMLALLSKSRRRLEIRDLMFEADGTRRKKSPQEMYRLVKTWAMAVNADAERRKAN